MTCIIIQCSQSKRPEPGLAGDVYTGALFRRASALAALKGWRIFILSGRHGLIRPWSWVEPYDEKRIGYTGPWPKGSGYWVGGKRYFRHAPKRFQPLCSAKAHGTGGGLKCMLAEINAMLTTRS